MEDEEPEYSGQTTIDPETWKRVLGSYLTITELCRTRRVYRNFRETVNLYLKENGGGKVIRGDDELAALYKLNSYPQTVRLESAKITLAGLQVLLQSGAVQDLEVVDCDHVNDAALTAVANSCKLLKRIHLDCRPVALAARNGYNGTRQMTVTDQAIKAIATGCSDLEALELVWARQVTDDAFLEVFGRCPRLSVFRLHWSRISDKALQSMGIKEHLRVLDIRTCKDVSDIGVKPVFRDCFSLEEVYLVDIACTDESLKELANSGVARRLQILFLSDLEHITDVGLKALAAVVSDELKTLHLSHLRNVTNDGLAALLASSGGVRDLSVFYTHLSDEGMKSIASNDAVGLQDLVYARFDGLKELTDIGLRAFVEHCPKLKMIECFNSRTTEATAQLLRSPRLNVVTSPW